jgi:hypothetical protein
LVVRTRFYQDRAALVALGLLVAIVLSCFVGEPIAAHFLGHFGGSYGASAGFSLLQPAPLGLHVLPATAFQPALPAELAPGARWSGAFAGTSTVPRDIFLYVGFGYFLPKSDAGSPGQSLVGVGGYGFNWLTTHTFRRPR